MFILFQKILRLYDISENDQKIILPQYISKIFPNLIFSMQCYSLYNKEEVNT